jgi:hypothetical protein
MTPWMLLTKARRDIAMADKEFATIKSLMEGNERSTAIHSTHRIAMRISRIYVATSDIQGLARELALEAKALKHRADEINTRTLMLIAEKSEAVRPSL